MDKKVLNPQAGRGFFAVDERSKDEADAIREMRLNYEPERALSKKKVRNLCAIRGAAGAKDRKCLIRVIR